MEQLGSQRKLILEALQAANHTQISNSHSVVGVGCFSTGCTMGSGYSLKKSASGPRPPFTTNLECSIQARGGSQSAAQLTGADLLLVPRAQLWLRRRLLAQYAIFM